MRMAAGKLQRIGNEEKLAQDVGDMLMSEYDPVRGTGCELTTKAKNLASPGVMDLFGDAFLARIVEDGVGRLQLMQEKDPRTSPTERIDPSKTTIDIRRPNKHEFLFFLSVTPIRGTPIKVPYRVRLRHQYPGRAAVDVFPRGVITDDSVP